MEDGFRARACGESWLEYSLKSTSGMPSCSSLLNPQPVMPRVFQASQIPQPPPAESLTGGRSISTGSFWASSATFTDWGPTFLQCCGAENNYQSMLRGQLMNSSSLNYRQENEMDCSRFQKEWVPKKFPVGDAHTNTHLNPSVSAVNSLPPINSLAAGSVERLACEGPSSTSFPMNLYSERSPVIGVDHTYRQEEALLSEYPSVLVGYCSPRIDNERSNYDSINGFSPSSLPKFPFLMRPRIQPSMRDQLQFDGSSTLAFKETGLGSCIAAIPAPTTQPPMLSLVQKSSLSNSLKHENEEVLLKSGLMVKKNSNEPAIKRPRLSTVSSAPLPTFKLRKEKIGDRITALQQLVSPFGKTDTASVLQEAVEYIKFLHHQVSALSTPYMKKEPPIQHQHTTESRKQTVGMKKELRSQGLCLVPISSTFPMATTATAADFPTTTFAGTFK